MDNEEKGPQPGETPAPPPQAQPAPPPAGEGQQHRVHIQEGPTLHITGQGVADSLKPPKDK